MSTLHNSLVGLETMQSRDDLEVRIQRQALALHRLLQDVGVHAMHPWNRPGLVIQTVDKPWRPGGGWQGRQMEYDVQLREHDGAWLRLCLKENTFAVSAYAANPATEYEVHIHLHPEGARAVGCLRVDAHARAFVHAERTLVQAMHAIRTNAPMEEGMTWSQSLARVLEGANALGSHELWKQWMEQWATESMRHVASMASSLADPKADFGHWKSIVLSGWRSLQEPSNSVDEPRFSDF